MEPVSNKKSFFSEWLEKLQQESWQLELLISGLALFGIWESQNTLQLIEYYLDVHSISQVRVASSIFMQLLWASWAIFLVNLLIHIIIRGFWIGAIGLRYVSGDINFEELNYSDQFTNYFQKRIGSFDNYIERLEKISSIIFSFTFLLFFMLLSFVMFNLVFGIFVIAITRLSSTQGVMEGQILGMAGIVYYGLGILVLIDFITLGAFKKIKDGTISRIYLWMYRFYSTISLSFLYRPLLLNFIDNSYTRKLFFLAIPYVIVLLGLKGFYLERYSFFPDFGHRTDYASVISASSINWMYYDDLRDEHMNTFRRDGDRLNKLKINYASINKHEFSGEPLKLFLEYKEKDGQYIGTNMATLNPFRKSGIRHTIFNNKAEDEGLKELSAKELDEIILARQVIRENEIPENADTTLVNYLKTFERDQIEQARDEIRKKHKERRNSYIKGKLSEIKSQLKNLYTVDLNNRNINDQLECSFFIHPNINERGLLCYYDIDSLSKGQYLLSIIKKNHDNNCQSDCAVVTVQIPFRKLN